MFINERISGSQAFILTVAAALGLVFLDIPTVSLEEGGRQGWLSVLPGYMTAIIMVYAVIKLGNRYPSKTIIQYAPDVMGTILGKLFGLLLIISFTIVAGLLIRMNTELLLFLMPETPPVAFDILIMTLVIYVVKWGFEVFARVCQILVPLIILGLTGIFFLSYENLELENFYPLFEEGMLEPLGAFIHSVAFATEPVLFMAFWYCTLRTQKSAFRLSAVALISVGLLLTVVTVVTLGTIGLEKVLNHTFSIFTLTRLIEILEFMEGFEGLLTIVWISASFIKVSILLYPAVIGLAQWLNLKDYKHFVTPYALITIGVAKTPDTVGDLQEMLSLANIYLILPLGLFLIVMAIVAAIRGVQDS
ncbi:GerAB/ArcD/ProY family transporter [Natranaerobius trueperi]|uniref:Uncharacterized protein n=1 Tax=Natranaerobius trueperi TaxID=759412 RepID=A0A226BY53_9FIRM|nr:GerAB/ArcD/ProY family transporter [Natranaerobius trueperi]OWZ83047.1 hypothetical protein CDO51_10820 [Natranaerobius trueperi]